MTIHVIPRDDDVLHETTNGSECICGPEDVLLKRLDGSSEWVRQHHSLDGRETEVDDG